jgi:hypothetical protein
VSLVNIEKIAKGLKKALPIFASGNCGHTRSYMKYLYSLLLLLAALAAAFLMGRHHFGFARNAGGRYLLYYHPDNYHQAFLLDSATGSLWQLQFEAGVPGKTDGIPEFKRVSVEGLYTSSEEQVLRSLDKAIGSDSIAPHK